MKTETKDKYDEAIEYLTENPHEIETVWMHPFDHKAGCLFMFVIPNDVEFRPDRKLCGCLTTIRNCGYAAWTDELTEAIRADDRIPNDLKDITIEKLPIFAEWQRRIDKELGRI